MMKRMTLELAQRGTIIQNDFNELFLILSHDKGKKSLRCLDQKFDEIAIGTDWLHNYYFYDKINMNVLIQQIKE